MTSIIAFLILSTVGLFMFGQVGRVNIPGYPVFFYAYEVTLGLSLIFFIVHYRLRPILESQLFRPFVLFFGWLVFSYLLSLFRYPFEQNLVAALYLVRLTVYSVFYLYVSDDNVQKILPHVLPKMLLALAWWFIGTTVIQYILYPNFGNLAYLGWDPHLYRAVGLFFDPPVAISVFVLFLLYFIFATKNKGKPLYILLIFTLLGLSLLTYSRGGLLGILLIGIVYVIQQRKKQWLIIGIAVVAILSGIWYILPNRASEGVNLLRTTSIDARLADDATALKIWQASPIVGIGYNHIRPEKDRYPAQEYFSAYNPSHASASFHSSFLIILVTTGVIGLGLSLFYLWSIMKISAFAWYGILYLSIISLFDNVLLHPFIQFLFFLLAAIRPSRR